MSQLMYDDLEARPVHRGRRDVGGAVPGAGVHVAVVQNDGLQCRALGQSALVLHDRMRLGDVAAQQSADPAAAGRAIHPIPDARHEEGVVLLVVRSEHHVVLHVDQVFPHLPFPLGRVGESVGDEDEVRDPLVVGTRYVFERDAFIGFVAGFVPTGTLDAVGTVVA